VKQTTHFPISRLARLYFRIALPILTLSSLTLLIFCLREFQREPLFVKHFYRPLLEYPIAGLTLTAAGGILIDYIERNQE